ncbi:southpaw isoform X1 [Kryptolebias marmoratus]|uniref:southpaw isoform X1 n=1 Tax=Kryptolebias marmoratus TaxID=37003 RepID=UPI0018ACB48C|nr:southpaw isoform X1 [Kryptolebias marmoratus]
MLSCVSFFFVFALHPSVALWFYLSSVPSSLFFFTTQQVSKCLSNFKGLLCFMWGTCILALRRPCTGGSNTHPVLFVLSLHCLDICPAVWLVHIHADCCVRTLISFSPVSLSGCHQVGDRWAVTFDMSSISTRELVLLAELQIKLPAFSTSKRAAVDLYHSRKQSCDLDRASCQEEEEEVFLGSLGATPSSTKASWKVFNVTELLKYWLYKRSDVLGQEASGEPDTGDGSGSGDPVNTDDKFSSNNLMAEQRKVNHPTTNRVMMVVFSKQQQLQEGHAAYSLIHTVENSKYVTPNSVRGDGQSRRHKRNRIKGMRAPDGAEPTEAPAAERVQRPLCRRVDMWVDFDHIGWDEWIVHPKRYNAYRCEGACPSPLDESFSPTNHAYMQSLLRLHHPDRVSCPSCVPTRLSPLSMLYYESDDLTLRHHEEMIVEECGCH